MEHQIFDRDELMERIGNDEELMEQLIELFLEDYPTRVAEIEAGFSEGNSEKTRKAAHTLKGMSGNLAFHQVYHTAKKMEDYASEKKMEEAEKLHNQLQKEIARVLEHFNR
ncbi:MAG TPA: Hpt domain-containing protein [Candidatus Marinimicrobia bacterium]|nr:Hpt domain-containing protein [Candidatus Neomarinimicrobiota bacterium]